MSEEINCIINTGLCHDHNKITMFKLFMKPLLMFYEKVDEEEAIPDLKIHIKVFNQSNNIEEFFRYVDQCATELGLNYES